MLLATMSGERVIGIDLGTTNSCAAIVEGDEQRVKLIPYRGGEYTIPSIYAIDDKGNELVGHDAKRQWQLNPERTIYGHKRLIGRQFDSELASKMHDYFAYTIVENKDRGEFVLPLSGRNFSLQDVAAKLLQKIRDVAQEYLQGPVTQAVITVPAYFNDRQRHAVRDAASRIGLDVLGIINEPTAAALAFGVGRGLAGDIVAIYDLGGGTFDISIVQIRDRVFEVKATGGDIFLGGVDFDNRIIEWVAAEFAKENSGIDLHSDRVAMQRIRDLAERTKIDLSVRKDAVINIPFITLTDAGVPLDVDMKLSRAAFEAMTEDLVRRTMDTCAQVCRDAGMKPEDVDHVLLVGGMTRMPRVQDAVTAYFKKAPSKQVNPDEAVAIGAAMYAHSFSDQTNQRLQVLDVIPMAIGIETSDGMLHEIFRRNEAVPNLKQMTFTTSQDRQETLEMRIYQGDRLNRARDNELLGEFIFSGIRVGQAGRVRVEVSFQLSQDGILEISARDRDTRAEMLTSVRLGQSA